MDGKAQLATVVGGFIVILCLIFHKQVGTFLETISSDAEEVTIGKSGIEVTFDRDKLENIPPPSPQFQNLFFELEKRERHALLNVGWFTPAVGLCTLEGFDSAISSPQNSADQEWLKQRSDLFDNYRDYIESYVELEKFGLVTIKEAPIEEPRVCTEGNGRKATITKAGQKVRSDYLKILDASLSVNKTADN